MQVVISSALLVLSISLDILLIPLMSQISTLSLLMLLLINGIIIVHFFQHIHHRYFNKHKNGALGLRRTQNSSILNHDTLSDNTLISKELNNILDTEILEKPELLTILNGIREGILVLNYNDEIAYHNRSFCKIFSINPNENLSNTHYKNFITIESLIEFINVINYSTSNYETNEIQINNKIYLISASISQNKKVKVLVFHDVSEIRALEKIKKDFVINASHELRTPLTSIKGFIELIQKNPEKNIKYIDIISRNTDRIINIVNDLLKLSKLEQAINTLSRERIDINSLIENTFGLFEKKLEQKNLTLEYRAQNEKLIVSVDKLKLEEVVINLIDNAIKYTEEGSIIVSTTCDKNHALIHITDTGIGIPKKYHTRIFERFFVVDKARSRKTGGTGLGLAIVKHIVQMHNGNIEVESVLGKGTTFTIKLPLFI